MPFTPYHFGPSGLLGLVFRKWLDLPVFVLANIVIDIEVLVILILRLGYPVHRYCHTFLIGAGVGILWGLFAYQMRHFFARLMKIFRLPYQASLRKMLISGVLGVWLHVLIDGIYHFDIHIFWPSRSVWLWRTMHRRIGEEQVKTACIILFIAALIVYVITVLLSYKARIGRTGGKNS